MRSSRHQPLTLLGRAHLRCIAFRLWRGADRPLVLALGAQACAQSEAQAYQLGLLTNLTNPMALVFYGSIFAALRTPDVPTGVKVAAFSIIAGLIHSRAVHAASVPAPEEPPASDYLAARLSASILSSPTPSTIFFNAAMSTLSPSASISTPFSRISVTSPWLPSLRYSSRTVRLPCL